jgi:hypothetical protein
MFMVLGHTGPKDVPWICELYRLFITEAEGDLFDCDLLSEAMGAFSGPADALASIISMGTQHYHSGLASEEPWQSTQCFIAI